MCMAARSYRLPLMLTPEESARLDEMRGSTSRAEFIRARVFETPQDAPSAPIEPEPAPAPPPKQELRLAANQRHLYTPRGKDWGTVRFEQYEFDLTGVE